MRSTLIGLAGLWAVAAQAGTHALPPAAMERVRPDLVGEAIPPRIVETDLRTLPRARDWQPGDPIREVPRRITRKVGDVPGNAPMRDPLADRQRAQQRARETRAFDVPVLNFAGSGFTGVNPSDVNGDVGPNHYIQTINNSTSSKVAIYNKATGALATPVFLLHTLGTGDCADGSGDPIVLYDAKADRWLLSEFSNNGDKLCVYISRSEDPVTGGWFAYSFQAPNFPDYPKYGVWPDGYYVSSNESDPTVYVLPRAAMLAGAPASFVRFTAPSLNGFGFQALQVADLDGTEPPPANAPAYYLRHRDDESHNAGPNPANDFIEIWTLDYDPVTPGNSTFGLSQTLNVSEFDSNLCGLTSFSCVPQPSGTNPLDPLREVVMWRVAYRKFAGHESMVGNFVTDVGTNQHAVRWFELRKTTGAWVLHQEGTMAPDSTHRWMGSIAMDSGGNIALGYSAAGATVPPGIRYAGRLAGDASGVLTQGEHTLIAGSASNSSSRWGDYSSMSSDPTSCQFWYTNNFSPASTWATRIGALVLDSSCPAQGPVGGDVTGPDTFPNAFSFVDQSSVPQGTVRTSNTVTISGIDVAVPITVTGGTYSIGCNGTFVSSADTISNGQTVCVRHTSAATPSTSVSTVLTVGQVSDTFTSTTTGTQLQNGVAVTNLSGASNSETLFEMAVPAGATNLLFTMSGGTGDPDLYVRFGSPPTTGTFDCRPFADGPAEQCPFPSPSAGTWYVMVRGFSAYSGLTLLGQFTPPPDDTEPDPFSFTAQTGVPAGSVRTSNAVTIGGINTAAPVSITNGSYSVGCTATFITGASTIADGQTVCVRTTASATPAGVVTATLDIGGVTGVFSVTTAAGSDTTPNAFGFSTQTGVPPGSVRTSNTVTIGGINAPAAISINNGGSYSIGCTATFVTTAGSITNGQTVCLRRTAPATASSTVVVSLTVGGVAGTWSITTAADTTPNAFTFLPQTGVPVSSVRTSNTQTITGISAPAAISVNNGSYSVGCTGTFVTTGGTISNNQTVCLRRAASPNPSTTTTTTLTIGGVAASWNISTADDTTPNAITFVAQTNVPPGSMRTSNTQTVSGISVPVQIKVTNGSYSIGCTGTFVTTAGTINNQQTVCLQRAAPPGASSTQVVALTVGTSTFNWTITTPDDKVPNQFTFLQQTDVPPGSVRTSNTQTITGISAPTPIAVSNGSYSIGCNGTFVTAAGTINNQQTVCVRHTAAAGNRSTVTTTLNIGGVSATFRSTTP